MCGSTFELFNMLKVQTPFFDGKGGTLHCSKIGQNKAIISKLYVNLISNLRQIAITKSVCFGFEPPPPLTILKIAELEGHP